MKIMSTYGGLTEKEDQRDSHRAHIVNGEVQNTTFKYKIPFANYFLFQHMIDGNNSIRHQVPSLEQTWTTHRWPNRVFAFLLALAEVNCYLAFRFFIWKGDEKLQFMDFRSKLGWDLINNEYLDIEEDESERRSKRKKRGDHELEKAPPHAKNWMGGRWDLTSNQKYKQFRCRGTGCKKQYAHIVVVLSVYGCAIIVMLNIVLR